jgi:signal transduction histidine kinase
VDRSVCADGGREVANLAADLNSELRSALTPIIGYLELLAEDSGSSSSRERQRWAMNVERRLQELLTVVANAQATVATILAEGLPEQQITRSDRS